MPVVARLLVSFALSLAAAGCTNVHVHVHEVAGAPAARERPGAPAREPRRGAAFVDPLDAVVRVASIGGECTGTLIAPRVVLTSRICHRRITSSADDESSDRLYAALGGGVVAYRSTRVVSSVGSPTRSMIALVLDESLDAPPIRLRLGATIALGEPVRVVGFGICGPRPASMRAVGFAGRVISANEETFTIDTARCRGDAGAPVISDWTGEIVGVVLDDDPALRDAARLDVAADQLAQAWLESHGARFSPAER